MQPRGTLENNFAGELWTSSKLTCVSGHKVMWFLSCYMCHLSSCEKLCLLEVSLPQNQETRHSECSQTVVYRSFISCEDPSAMVKWDFTLYLRVRFHTINRSYHSQRDIPFLPCPTPYTCSACGAKLSLTLVGAQISTEVHNGFQTRLISG